MVLHHSIRPGGLSLQFQGTLFLILGIAVTYLGYSSSAALFNADEVVGPALSGTRSLMLLLTFPLRDAAKTCYRGLRTKVGTAVFWPFLAVHLFIYGFLLEVILASVYGVAFAVSPSLTVATEVFKPPSALSILFDLSFNPSISFTLPPVLSGALSFYGFAVAVLVGVLVLANVIKTVQLGKALHAEKEGELLLPGACARAGAGRFLLRLGTRSRLVRVPLGCSGPILRLDLQHVVLLLPRLRHCDPLPERKFHRPDFGQPEGAIQVWAKSEPSSRPLFVPPKGETGHNREHFLNSSGTSSFGDYPQVEPDHEEPEEGHQEALLVRRRTSHTFL